MDDEPTTAHHNVWDERRLRIATEAAGVALWSWNLDTDRLTLDDHAFELWGLPAKAEIAFEELSVCIHPADIDKVRASFTATRSMSGPYEIDFRILHGDDIRWISARGRGDDEGIIGRVIYGVFLDVTYRKQAEEEREMVAREMHHRVKNMFSLSSAVASIASRSTETKEEMLGDLTRRLHGLSAAHTLTIPQFYDQKQSIPLKDLLTALLEPYETDPSSFCNLCISAPDVRVGERAITTLAMIIHELATNSAKYGALSAAAGKVTMTCREGAAGQIEVVWNESGGPVPDPPDRKAGFGTAMTERVIQQVNGSIDREWTDDGLVVTLHMDKALLGA